MPFITEDLQYITVRLEGQTNSGISVGTGFYFGYKERLFLVTNKHVVSDVVNGSFVSMCAKVENGVKTPLLGQGLKIPFNKENFIGHPDPVTDVSVMNLSDIVNQLESNASHIYYKCITLDSIPNKEQIQQLIGANSWLGLICGSPNIGKRALMEVCLLDRKTSRALLTSHP